MDAKNGMERRLYLKMGKENNSPFEGSIKCERCGKTWAVCECEKENKELPVTICPLKEDTFNLSEKRKELFYIILNQRPTAGRIIRIINQQDKEFIKSLKKEAHIDLAGDFLIIKYSKFKELAGED